MLLTILILFGVAVLCYFGIQHYLNYQWGKKPLHNFPFFYRGKEYWYSRAVAVTHFVFCKNLKVPSQHCQNYSYMFAVLQAKYGQHPF